MERNATHFTESSAKLPLRPKEMILDVSAALPDERFSETTAKPEERRGFRPAPRLQALQHPRGKQRSAVAADAMASLVDANGSLVGHGSSSLGEATTRDTAVVHLPQRHGRRRSVEFALTATPQMRLKAKAQPHGRPLRISETVPPSQSRSLWVEGNSVLNADASAAAAALSRLSECAVRERRLKEEWEAARFAKLQAFRAVVHVFMISFSGGGARDGPHPSGKGITDVLAVARCSVVTNALVGTVQSFARAFRSRQLAASRGTLPSTAGVPCRPATGSTELALSSASAMPHSRYSGDDSTFGSDSYATGDALDQEEVARLRQLYFDYFDCEAVSISTLNPSGSEANEFGDGGRASASRPQSVSSLSMSNVEDFSTLASRTM